ncbi:hypothetical protein JCM6882_008952 [Rhodosporidiobolus microsporus]
MSQVSPTDDHSAVSYPPYASRPAVSSSIGHHGGAQTPPFRTGSVVGASGGKESPSGNYPELTKEDKQEGYDVDLLNLPERNTAAAQQAAAEEALKRASSPPVNAASLPYASRTAGESSSDGIDGANGTKGVRHHHSSARRDHHRANGHGAKDSAGRKRSTRRKKKPLKWYQKRMTLIIFLVAIVVIGLAVGLGVGLTAGKDDDNDNSDSANSNPASTANQPSGVAPSASGADGGVEVSASGSGEEVGAATVSPAGPQETGSASDSGIDGLTQAVQPATPSASSLRAGKRAARWI